MANVKMKLIFVDEKRKDGTTFKVMKTILKNGDQERWIEVKFDESVVNVKAFKNENKILVVEPSKVHRVPENLEKWTNKEGKERYPYIFIDDVVSAEPLKGKARPSAPITQDMFVIDEEDTESVEIAE